MFFRATSIIFAAVLRAVGDTRTPMAINVLMNLCNVTLNFLLINPPSAWRIGNAVVSIPGAGLGVTGAAIATAVSFILGGTLMTVFAFRAPKLQLGKQPLRYDRSAMVADNMARFLLLLRRYRGRRWRKSLYE